jgi:hypothetical protein
MGSMRQMVNQTGFGSGREHDFAQREREMGRFGRNNEKLAAAVFHCGGLAVGLRG